MKSIKFSHLLFSFAMVAALVLAALPTASASALSDSAMPQTTSIGASNPDSTALTAAGALVCRTEIVWRHGHRISIRVCHRVHPQETR